MPQQQAAAGKDGDNALDFLWIIVMVLGAIVLTWYFGKEYIAQGIFTVRTYEIKAIEWILGGWNKAVQFSHLPLPQAGLQDLQEWTVYMQQKPVNLQVATLMNLSTAVGKYLAIPIALILTLLAGLIYRTNLTAKLKNIYSMNRLKKIEQPDWPQITPVLELDLVKEDINKGPWAMAMTPLEFCKKNNLLKISSDNQQTQASLLAGAAQRVLSLQLGGIWAGVERLPIHAQALFGIFAARANRDRDAADALLKQIALSSAHTGKLDFTGAAELAKKYATTKGVQQIVRRHAYVNSAMASMLELARTDGVLASADFLWLKPVDRKLWYMLNSVGRQTAVPEIAGAFAHWLVEKQTKRALKVPMVQEAVKALEAALKDIIYEPDEA